MSQSAASPPNRSREVLITAGLIGVVVFGLVGLAAATGWEETWASITRLTVLQVAILLLLSLVNYVFRAIRWHRYAVVLGIPVTVMQTLRHYFGGFALTVTPGRVGELIRLRWLSQEAGTRLERSAPLLIVDRAADVAAMGILTAVAVSLSTIGASAGVPVAVIALIFALIVTRESLFLWAVNLTWRIVGRWPRLFARLRRAGHALGPFSDWPVVIPALVLGIAGWFAEGYAFHLLLVWMGADIGLWTAVGIFTISALTGGATGSPGGLGGAEAAMVALLSVQGVPLEVSIPATAVIRLTTLWFAILIGLFVFPAAQRIASRTHYARQS